MNAAPSDLILRLEQAGDADAIRGVIEMAFLDQPHSRQTEARVVDRLRAEQALSLSLVALRPEGVVGYVACAGIGITGGACGWHCIGPVAVRPDQQGGGVGTALVWHALRTLRAQQAAGCVALGEPAYFGRFGFRSTPALRMERAPYGCFLVRPFERVIPMGTVQYHEAFDLVEPSDWTFP